VIAYAYAEPAGLGWLGAKQSENSRTVYARDIGITPQRRASRAIWLPPRRGGSRNLRIG
jgi:hypothetical protein